MHVVAADERVKRMLYISQLNGNEHPANPPSIKPYRVETFIPSDNLSVICYNTQTTKRVLMWAAISLGVVR